MRSARLLKELAKTATRAHPPKTVEPVFAPVAAKPNINQATYNPGLFTEHVDLYPEQLGQEDSNQIVWFPRHSLRNDTYE